jgi:hypothetical protein
MDSPSPSLLRSVRFWNGVAALGLLVLSLWMAAADFRFSGHFILQSSWSTVFLGLWLSAWTLAAVIFAGFSKRFVLLALLLATLRFSFGWPLLERFDLRFSCLLLDGLLVALALVYLVLTALAKKGFVARPWFRWQHSALMGVAWLGSSLLSLPLGILGFAKVIDQTSRGYVRLTPQGISLTERIFEKDGRKVHLFGMAHIAEGDFYEALHQHLAQPLPGGRLVLTEGVHDKNRILPASFASGSTYREMAEALGLKEQKHFGSKTDQSTGVESPWEEEWKKLGVTFLPADIDVSELSPEHQEQLVQLLSALDGLNLASIFSNPGNLSSSELEELIVEGLVKQRNARLMEVFLAEYRNYAEVFIPWGAAHLPDLEQRLLALGYLPIAESSRLGIDFWKRWR